MALDMLGRQHSLDVPDYFLPGFDSSLDDSGVDPWPVAVPVPAFEVSGSQPTCHELVSAISALSRFCRAPTVRKMCLGAASPYCSPARHCILRSISRLSCTCCSDRGHPAPPPSPGWGC